MPHWAPNCYLRKYILAHSRPSGVDDLLDIDNGAGAIIINICIAAPRQDLPYGRVNVLLIHDIILVQIVNRRTRGDLHTCSLERADRRRIRPGYPKIIRRRRGPSARSNCRAARLKCELLRGHVDE